jgi:hypothetical protein
MPAAGVEIKTSTMHVEAAIRVISGRGFDSPRLHSTRCARSWQASIWSSIAFQGEDLPIKRSSESNALSKRPGLSLSKAAHRRAYSVRPAPADSFFVYIVRAVRG